MTLKKAKADQFDLMTTDNRTPGADSLNPIKQAKELDSEIEDIILTGHTSFENVKNAVEASKNGRAYEYLTKPLEKIDDLSMAVSIALKSRKLIEANKRLIKELEEEVNIRKEAQNRLEHSKNLLLSFFDGISEPLIMIEKDMTVKLINMAAKNYFHLSEFKDIIGKLCYKGLRQLSKPCKGCIIPSMSGKSMSTFERKGFMDPGRSELVAGYSLTKDECGLEGMVFHIKDITEKKNIDAQLERADRLSSLGQLSAGIAHEIRNPLTAIQLFVDILYNDVRFKVDDNVKEILHEINKNINRIDGIITCIRSFAKPSILSLEKLNINSLIREHINLWSSKFRGGKINLNLSLSDGLPDIQGDSIGLQQVLNNLILNAVEAMQNGGALDITTSQAISSFHKDRKVVALRIKDTGCGINPDDAKKVFNPFFTTKLSGTGLGMVISHKILERHGATISFDSQPCLGTTFTVELPSIID